MPRTTAAPRSRGVRRWALEAAILAAILTAGVLWTRDIPRTTDVDPWDESSALARGLEIGRSGFPAAQDAPLYAAWYGSLAPFAEDRVALYYLAHRATVILLPASLAVFLLATGAARVLALVLPVVLLCGPLVSQTWPRVGHFAAALLLLGTALVLRLEGRRARLLAGILVALALAFVRPELFVGCLLLTAGAAAVGWRSLASRDTAFARSGRWALVLGLVLLAAAGLPAFLGTGERQSMAFGQHYAVFTAEDLGPIEPWTRWREVVARDFGSVGSPLEALRANPAAFAVHFGSNAWRLPGAWLRTLGRTITAAGSVWVGLVLLLPLAIPPWRRSGVRSPVPEDRWREVGIGWSLLFLPIAGSCLVVYPREHYLILAAVPVLGFVASRSLPRGTRGASAVAACLAVLSLAGAWLSRGAAPGEPSSRERLRMVRALEEIDDGRRLRIVEAEGGDGGLCKFLESPCLRLGPELAAWRPSDVLDPGRPVDAVVVSPRMERYGAITSDPLWPVLRHRPARLGFRRSAIHPGVLIRVGPPRDGGDAPQ